MRNLFVSKVSGSIVRILKTDDSYAYLEIMYPTPSKWAMPKSQYEADFVREYRPASLEDFEKVQSTNQGKFELPKNAPEEKDWPRK